MIDLSQLRRVEVDGEAKIAHAGGGSTWLDFDAATQAFGLVAPGGVVGSTGVCGLTLGGGIGHLTAQLGLTCDHLVGAELVTPAGAVVQASADEEGSCSGGLRGGAETSAWRPDSTFASTRSRESSAARSSSQGPARAKRFAGSATSSAALPATSAARPSCRWTSRWRRLSSSRPATRARLPIRMMSAPSARGQDSSRTLSARTVSRPATCLRLALRREQALLEGTLRPGASRRADRPAARGARGARPRAGRDPVRVASRRAEGRRRTVRADRLSGGCLQHQRPGDVAGRRARRPAHRLGAGDGAGDRALVLGAGYVNYMQADEPIERVRAAFGAETFERLQALKRRYDPANVLRRNQNIPPG